MKKLLVLLVLCGTCCGQIVLKHKAGGGGGPLIQTATSGVCASSPCNAVFPAPVAAGHLVACSNVANASASGITVAMTGETVTNFNGGATNLLTGGGSSFMINVYFKNTVGGQTTVTTSFSSGLSYSVTTCSEFSGLSTTAPEDGSAVLNGTLGGAGDMTTGSVTPSGASRIAFGICRIDAAATLTINNGYSSLRNGNSIAQLYKVVSAATSISVSSDAGGGWGCSLAIYK
jgi:hypothetical protein